MALYQSPLVSEVLRVRTNHRTDRHEQGESSSRTHDVVTQGSHDTVWSSSMLEDGKTAEQDTHTDTDGATHKSTHLELVEVGRLLVVHGHFMMSEVDQANAIELWS